MYVLPFSIVCNTPYLSWLDCLLFCLGSSYDARTVAKYCGVDSVHCRFVSCWGLKLTRWPTRFVRFHNATSYKIYFDVQILHFSSLCLGGCTEQFLAISSGLLLSAFWLVFLPLFQWRRTMSGRFFLGLQSVVQHLQNLGPQYGPRIVLRGKIEKELKT